MYPKAKCIWFEPKGTDRTISWNTTSESQGPRIIAGKLNRAETLPCNYKESNESLK